MKRLLAIIMMLLLAATMFTACSEKETAGEVNTANLDKIVGEYQVVANEDENDYVGSWWHLDILADDEEYGNYLSIYDNEAGNPGVEGEIVSLDDVSMTIKIDPELYDELPSSKWKDSGEYLELTYERTSDGIILTNNGKSLKFNWEEPDDAEE